MAQTYQEKLGLAAKWMTDKIDDLFYAEIANERNGGESPATVGTAIDSLAQGEGIMDEGWVNSDFIHFLYLTLIAGTETELKDLLRAHSEARPG